MATSTTIGSKASRQKIQRYLRDFNLKALFVEELGWDILKESPLTMTIDGMAFVLRPLVEKRGVKVFVCDPDAQGQIPVDGLLRKIEREVTRLAAYEQFIIYVDKANEHQVWQWVKREQGKRTATRMNRYHKGQSGELLAQKLERLAVRLEEEEYLHMSAVVGRVARAFDVERVTKKFYERFKLEYKAFLTLIQGIEEQTDREWYASLMLNRLMFIYFIQRRGFLDTQEPGKLDGDPDYLSNRLKRVQQARGGDQFHTFYRYFLLKLFHDGLSQRDHSPELEKLLGKVPYLNGGLFDTHMLERLNPEITIPDEAFVTLFAFFDEFDWHLDDRPLHNDREINPDVLGFIFEKYINQKQMGAYYTKEDITEYISKNTILPFILDAAEQKCSIAFHPDGPVWMLLRENPEVYLYDAVKKGCELLLPPEIAAGVHDVAQRGKWNESAPEAYALPTETWREVVARRTHYQEVRSALVAEQITSVNDLITYNLDIRHFAEDVITYCTSTDLLRALYESIAQVTVLDPTCGSGAFLFAALNILEGLYEACLERMQDLVEERAALDASPPAEKRRNHPDILHFRALLEQVGKHSNRASFIYKSIIINNLYGVDIMKEATEICKLRLFLKLVSHIETFNDIEPLPDIDFNIRAGNTLVGFASYEETKQAIEGRAMGKGGTKDEVAVQSQMIFDDRLDRIEQKAQEIERAFEHFRALQTTLVLDSAAMAASKQQLRQMLGTLRAELDGYLASEYGIDRSSIPKKAEFGTRFARWQQSHQPFHWWVEFYGIMKRGGFDVIIGNPPYVEYGTKQKSQYRVLDYLTLDCGNLHAYVTERSLQLAAQKGYVGLIVPLPAINTARMKTLQQLIKPSKELARSLYVAAFDERPGSLFTGVDQRLVIAILTSSTQSAYLATTGINRWAAKARDSLFHTLTYAMQSEMLQHLVPFILKIKHAQLERQMLSAFYDNTTIEQYRSLQKTPEAIAYRTAGGRYWKVILDHPFDSESLSNKIAYLRGITAQQVVALISSSTFWWYYSCHFDMYNLKDYMIFGFRFGNAKEEIMLCLQELGEKLLLSLHDNSTVETVKSKTRGEVTSRHYIANKSKYIIDEIDRVLAQHYGFTAEELDFIINYDIKYRVGRDNGTAEEE